MISNGTIRKYVTERIKPFRLKVFGYALVFGIIIGVITGTIGSVLGFIASIIGALISLPISAIFNLAESDASSLNQLISQSLSSICSIVISLFTSVFAIGYTKEMLMSVNDNDDVSPVDFFKLGWSDWKRIVQTYLRLWLKYLPALIIIFVGAIITVVGGFISGNEIISIVIALTGLAIIFAGWIYLLIVSLLYQTIPYELIYDETSSAKDILIKARETLRGHFWQWTRMNYFYMFIFFIVMLVTIIGFTVLIGLFAYLVSTAGNGAAAIGILMLFIGVFAFALICIAASFLLQYFTAKNIYNLDELYKVIQKEKSGEVSPI